METGLTGTFVISWSQTELDGQMSAPIGDLSPGRAWTWVGEAVRVDGPSGVVPLGVALGEADLRKRAALTVRRLLRAVDADVPEADPVLLRGPLFDSYFTVTNGFETWDVTLIGMGAGRKPLLMFRDRIPPSASELWVVRSRIARNLRIAPDVQAGGVICFTPGTKIMTPTGHCDVAALREGDFVQTQDNGPAEILWIGRRHVTGARLKAIPALVPVRLRAGSLDQGVPDAGLLVSPDHRMVLRGPRARALFNTDEVLVTARDLVDDYAVIRDHAQREVTYIHMMLESHQIVMANGVATESFHPASAALATMEPDEVDRLFERLPDIRGNTSAYGGYARRVLSESDAAVLRSDVVPRGWV